MDAEGVVGFEHLYSSLIIERDSLDIERIDSDEEVQEIGLDVDRLSDIEASLNEFLHRGKDLGNEILEELSEG